MSKRLGGSVGCEDKTSPWHLIGFQPDGSNIESTISIMSVISHIQRIGCQPDKATVLPTVANPARGLLNREKRTKRERESGSAPFPSPRQRCYCING